MSDFSVCLYWCWQQALSHKGEAEEAVPAVDVAVAVAHPRAWVQIVDWGMRLSVRADVRMMG